MKTLFILIVFWQGDTPENGNALWAIQGQENCETVAEIFSLNSEPGEVFTCLPAKGE